MEKKNILKKIGELLLHCVLWYLTINYILIPIAPILLFVVIVRSTESLFYYMMYNATPLALEEIPWNHNQLKNLPVINVVMLMDEKVDVNKFRELVLSRMLEAKDEDGVYTYSKGRQYMTAGFFNFYWTNVENFDIREHVYEIEEEYNSIEELKKAVSLLATTPFKKNKSPWEFILLKYYESSSNDFNYVIMFRIHHAITDGTSLIYLLLNVLSDEISLQIKPRRFSNIAKFYVYAQAYLNVPFMMLKQLIPYTPSHSLHCTAASERKMFTWSDPISLPMIHSIKKKLNVTINDVMVGTLAKSFHEYFKEKGEKIPNEIISAFPVDVRSDISAAKTFSNKFAILPVPVPTASGDVISNIRKMHEHMKVVKEYGVPTTYHAGMCVLNYFLPSIINDAIQFSFICKTSLVLSNVAGPQVPVKLGGNTVKSICFWPAPKYNVGMSCSIFSYKDNMIIGYSRDDALTLDVDEILRRIPIILHNLAKTLEGQVSENSK